MRILITGARSPFVRHLTEHVLFARPDAELICYSLEDIDFAVLEETILVVQRLRPDVILHCEIYGDDSPEDFEPSDKLFQNMSILLNMFEAAAHCGVGKVVICAPQSVYPEDWFGPLKESDLAMAPIAPGIAPIAQTFQFAAAMGANYLWQTGVRSTMLILGDIIGEHYMEGNKSVPVIAGVQMVRAAMDGRAKLIELPWAPTNSFEFTFAQDAAAIVLHAIETDLSGLYNVGPGRRWSGIEILAALKAASGFTGVMHLQTARPDAAPAKERYLEVNRMAEAGQACATPLAEGLRLLLAAPTRHGLGGGWTNVAEKSRAS